MIDYGKLGNAYEKESFYSLQLEVGDRCEQGCIYCYMNALENETNTLSDSQIRKTLEDAARLGITAIEWLGGEPLLRESIFEHMDFASSLGLRNNMWTGGLPLADEKIRRNTAELTGHGLIAVHVSTVYPEKYKQLHPERPSGDLYIILDSIHKTLDLGYPPDQMLNSATFTGLQSAEDMVKTIDYFEQHFGIKTSLNVYHSYLRPGTPPGELDRFVPSLEEVKKVYARYSRQWGDDLPMNCVNKQYCSATLAVLCDGCVTPCATIREKDAPSIHRHGSLYRIAMQNKHHLVFKRFRQEENLPPECRKCDITDQCFGCRSRSYAAGRGIYGMDPMCFRNKP
ncbi:MAG: radical SAM/SPASM domain-containing protein [Spirochaetota bacterium]